MASSNKRFLERFWSLYLVGRSHPWPCATRLSAITRACHDGLYHACHLDSDRTRFSGGDNGVRRYGGRARLGIENSMALSYVDDSLIAGVPIMSSTAKQQLHQLITEYGPELSEDPKRVKALLLDVCSEHRREANVLIAAAEKGVSSRLYRDGGKTPANIITPGLVNQLHNELGIDRTLAEWAVNVWRVSLLGIEKEVNTNLPTNSHKPVSTVKAVKTVKTTTSRVAVNVNKKDSKSLVNGKAYIFFILAILVVLLRVVNFGEVGFSEAEEAPPLATIREEYRIASEQGDAEAQHNLAFMYREGLGGEQSDEKAIFWYRSAALYGNAKAQVFMGWLYQEDINVGIEVFNENAVDWYLHAALPSIEKNDELAVSYYLKAATQGNADGQYLLDLMYEKGVGAKKNKEAVAWYPWYRQTVEHAVVWYRQAAEQGSIMAQYLLGWIYQNGIGVEKDNQEAVFWYLQAAEQSSAAAQFKLGEMYHNGWGVQRNDEQAVTWHRLAANQDHVNAQYRLAQMYRHGQGVTKDNIIADEWMRKAAELGHYEAQNYLGLPYEAIF